MVAQETVEIILRAQDQASPSTQKVDEAMKKIGDTVQQANQKAAQASQTYNQKLEQTKAKLGPLVSKVNEVGNQGAESFRQLSSSQQDSVIKFNMLDKETQTTLQAIRELGVESMDLIPGADSAIQKLASMDDKVKSFGGSFDYAKSKMELMGASTDTLKGKLQVVGNGIQNYIGNKWDTIKSKVSSFGNYIVSHLSSALSTVKSKIDSLGNAFNGLGGVLSSVFGGIGLKSVSDMTVGLSINRDRVQSLMSSVIGAGNGFYTFWDNMDTMTNNSLVSLDELSQAMSTIKMSTGANTTQLKAMLPVVNDIGQRAILMGRTGDEAISLMQAAGKGLNGEFAMLQDNFGISKEKLEELGWDGSAEDVRGYTRALDAYLQKGGSLEDMMNTTSGRLTTLQKNWRIAGRNIGDKFLPYLDQALDKLNALTKPTKDGSMNIAHYAIALMGLASGFATLAPSISPVLTVLEQLGGATKSSLVFMGLLKGSEDALTISGLSASISQKMLSVAQAAGADAAVLATAANKGLAASFRAMSLAILTNPLTWVVVALIAIAVAVYEVGKSFGWWTDVNSMLQAIWAGIQRIWTAFISHPDVQAAIQSITVGVQWLARAIGDAWNAICDFFGVSTGSNWDIVSTLIHNVGQSWENTKAIISTVGGVIQAVAGVFSWFYDSVLVPIGSFIGSVLGPVFSTLGSIWSNIVTQVMNIVNVFNLFKQGQTDLIGVVSTVASSLLTIWLNMNAQLLLLVYNLANQLSGGALSAGLRFLTGILTYIRQVPGRVAAFLVQTRARILTQLTLWVSLSRAKAMLFVETVVNFFRKLPSRAYSALIAVVSKILEAGSQWVSNVKTKAQAVVDGAYNTLTGISGRVSSALSGVKDAIVKPFQDAYNQAKELWDKIKNLGGGAAGGDHPMGGDSLPIEDFNSIVNSDNVVLVKEEIEGKFILVMDLQNLPEGITADDVAKILDYAATDDKFVKKLAENSTFQKYNIKSQLKIEGKNKRAMGV